MKRHHIFTCTALLFLLPAAACVPANTRYPSSSSQLYDLGRTLLSEAATSTSSTARLSQNFPTGLPQTYSEFKSRCKSVATSPEGAVKMYFDAVFCYLEPQRRAEASKMLRYIMHADANLENNRRYVTFLRRMKDSSYHYIFRSFAVGTSPENGYSMSPQNYQLAFSKKSQENDYMRIFLISSGSDRQRVVWVKQYEDGLWYVINNADTYLDVRAPRDARAEHSHDADYDNVY